MAEVYKPAVVCWDLDDTIGNFGGMRLRNPEYPITLRYGMHELLSEFSEENGYKHVITTSAGIGYADEALKRTHLDKKFSHIYGNDTVEYTVFGKHYNKVEPHYSVEDKSARMLVIGDSEQDKPLDIAEMVFIHLGRQEEQVEGLVIREILTKLLDEGEGNFNKGYENLYKQAEAINPDEPDRRTFALSDDISFDMELGTASEVPENSSQRIPTIKKIRSKEHMKPFQPFF